MAKTRIGTKLLANSSVTTAKLGTSAVTRDKIASGSVQVGHLDLFQARNDIAHLEDTDVLIVSASKGDSGGMRTVTFAHLKAAVSASNAAAGDTGHIQFHQGPDQLMGAIAKIRTDGVHLTASDGGKIVFAFTGISGSTAALSASSKTALRIDTKATLEFAIDSVHELSLNASALFPDDNEGLNLGSASKKFGTAFVNVLSGSGTSTIHKLDVDVGTFDRAVATVVTSSGTSLFHKLTVDDATFGAVKATNISGSGTAQIHKLDVDVGTFNKAIATVVTGSGTSLFHKLDVDLGTIDRVSSAVVTGSGTSTFHKLDVDQATVGGLVATNITSSGTTQLHNLTVSDVSGTIGEFRKLTVDVLNARQYKSTVTTSEHFEIANKQIIAAVSSSAGAAAEGAGLQIGGTAGSGSAGIASVIVGDAGGGAGKDLIFKIGSTQGLSLSATGGRKNDAVLFGVSGTLSASIGIFQELDIAKSLNASSYSGSSGTFHTISGSIVTAHFVDADQASINDIDGTSATLSSVVSSSTATIHSVDADKINVNDLDGTSAVFTTVSGTTVQAHTVDADKATIGDLHVVNVSGSGVSTIHKLNADVLSGSKLVAHVADFDKLTVNQFTGNDVIKAANLNRDIVFDADNGHGGLSFANGVLSVGHRRKVFSRDTTVANSTNLSAGSGSLFTTASLANDAAGNPQIILSGSEMVYLNGVLLVPAPAAQRPPVDGDYTINYNTVNGPVIIELHESLSLDSDDILVVQYLSGTIS